MGIPTSFKVATTLWQEVIFTSFPAENSFLLRIFAHDQTNVPVPENTQSIPTAPKMSIDPDLVPVGNHFLLSQKYRTELIALPADSFTSQQALSRENKLRTFLDSGILRHARPLVCHQLLFLSNYSLCDYYPSQSYSIILIQVCDVAYTYSALLQIGI